MVTEKELESTSITMRYELSPVRNIIGDLSGLIGSFCDEFMGAFYSRNTGKRANIVITELFDNAVRNNEDNKSAIVLELKKNTKVLSIMVANKATRKQYAHVRDHVAMIEQTDDKKQLLADTIRSRRKENLRGGLGLMRLIVENKFCVSVEYEESILQVTAELGAGGSA